MKCIICYKDFSPKRSDAKCCSLKCATKHWKARNRSKAKIYRKKFYEKNKVKVLIAQVKYKKSPKGLIKRKALLEKYKTDGTAKKHKKKFYDKLKKDPIRFAIFKIISNCRKRVNQSVKTFDVIKSNERKIELFGCTSLELKQHLEGKFTPEMTWDNYGKFWEVDHIIPLSRFDITIRSERNKANHYTNLQPLEQGLNRKLRNKKI